MIVREPQITSSSGTVAESAAGPTLASRERYRVLVEWNRTEAPFPRHTCLHELFERQAAATPALEALVVGHQRLAYEDLNARANRIAHRLRLIGVGPETLVGIFLTRTADMVAALLGVLKAGGAYVPMDPAYPGDRIAFMLEDARVHAVLTDSTLGSTLRQLIPAKMTPAVIELDVDDRLGAMPVDNPALATTPDNLGYVIYTSGSTGCPKGVGLEHRNAVAFLHWAKTLYEPDELRGVLSATSICFDPSILELFLPLSFGGKVILAENALALPGLPAANEVRLMDTVPSAMRELLRLNGLPASLSAVNLGGETVSDELVRQLYARPHIKRVYDQYGPTETTTTATCALRDPAEPGCIGRPIANTTAYLLNEHLEPVALGEPGELCIGGAGVARGYLHRAELTAAKFIPDPFSHKPGARLYRTGDLCRFRPDGRLDYLGRIDQQVKIHGHRVELGEIETVLRSHPAIEDAVVIMREDVPGRPRLTAYLVAGASTDFRAQPRLPGAEFHFVSGLREFVHARLPHYMVPAFFVPLQEFPLTANGKIDRKALPAPPRLSSGEDSHGYRAPRNATEEGICEIWKRVLGVSTVGIHDNFFDIGGDSLSGAVMLAEAGELKGIKLPIDSILKAPTVAKLAAILDGRAPREGGDSSLVGVQTRGHLPRFYLVHGIGGGMLWGYANLSRHLGTDQPVYVFTAPELESGATPPSLAAMANRYVEELRQFQPSGPYFLGGYCFGGNVAYEMARLLRAQGQEVSFLALFNCWPTRSSYDRFRPTPVQLWRFGLNLCFWVGRFVGWEPGTRRNFLKWKLGALRRKLAACFRLQTSRRNGLDVDNEVDVSGLPKAQQNLWREHVRAIHEHETGPYDGTISLFRTRGHPLFCSFDHQCGWGELARGVTVHVLPGQHETLMAEPHVGNLAKALKGDFLSVCHRPSAILLSLIIGVSTLVRPAVEHHAPPVEEASQARLTDTEVAPGERRRVVRRFARFRP